MSKTRKPSLPAVPADASMQQRQFMEAVKQYLEIGEGQRGDPQDRKLTERDLLELGLASLKRHAKGRDGAASRMDGAIPDGVGDGPEPDLTTPPDVAGFEVDGAATRVIISWDRPAYANHGYTEIWRSASDVFSEATLVGTSGGWMFVDVVGGAFSAYYWARHVSSQGVEGGAAGPEHAETPPDAEYILDQLEGKITESQLFESLGERIDLIDADEDVPGSVGYRIKNTREDLEQSVSSLDGKLDDTRTDLEAEIDALQAEMADLTDTPDFDPDEDWEEGDLVQYEGALWRALKDLESPVDKPDESDDWEKVGDFASLGDAVSAHAAQLDDHETRITDTEDGVAAVASDVSQLAATVEDPDTGLESKASSDELTQAKADIYGAEVTDFSNISAQFQQVDDDLENKVGQATLDEISQAKSDIYGSEVSQFTQLEARFESVEDDVDGKATADDITQAKADIYGSEVSQFTEIEAKFDQVDGDLSSKASVSYVDDAIADEESARASALSTLETELQDDIDTKASLTDLDEAKSDIYGSEVSQFTNLEARFESVEDDFENKVGQATIDEINNAKADIYGAEASQFTQIQAKFDDLEEQIGDDDEPDNVATIEYVDDAVADEASARASAIQTLQAEVDDNTSSLQTKAEVSAVEDVENDVTAIKAEWSVRVDQDGVVSGIGLIAEDGESEFGVRADRFFIADPENGNSSDPRVPFIVEDGEVFLRKATIPEAAIGVANIEEGFLDNLTAAYGQLAAARIDVAEIWDLDIGNTMQSSNWSAGSDGWRLDANGDLELNSGIFRGQLDVRSASSGARLEITGDTISVYDDNGALRARLGNLG